MDFQLVDTVATAILAYVQCHPQSADTAHGIHLWWIDWHDCIERPEVTLAALEHLESQGLMEQISIGNRQLWRKPRAID